MAELNGAPNGLGQKVAVVTGGTRGLGLAIALALSKAGASVMVASRSQASVDEVVAQITSAGGKAAGLAVDVFCLADASGTLQETTRYLPFACPAICDLWPE